ncbi:MAG: type II secretion system F family protein [Candidatus Liptonbacteria bacterium]|nr:type II secretion system F family protein [Candidatus Liptonbacteria bacterium]
MNNPIPHLGRFWERISAQERINFTRHLAIVVKAGVPLVAGLKIIRRQAESPMLGKVIDQLALDINNGKFLSDSLAQYPHLFSDFYISIVRMGESSGTLTNNLFYLAEEMEKSRDLSTKIKSAMVYPIFVMVATVGVVALLVLVVFPKILPVFASLKAKLPLSTRTLIAIMNLLNDHGLSVLVISLAVIIAWRVLLARVPSFRYRVSRAMLFMPVVAPLASGVAIANLTRVCGILLKSGIRLVDAMHITSQTMGNLVYRRSLQAAAEDIRQGETLAQSLDKHGRIYPPLVTGLIEIGESTGNLEENLLYLSEYYTKEVQIKTGNLTVLLEPALLLFMGLIVGFVALAIITPIYEATSAFGS